ncbi:MAG: phosphoribosylamine--glycine ligase [Myxococcota bacterium]
MRVLLVGGGGREHALATALIRSPGLTALAATHAKPAWPAGTEVLGVSAVADIARAAVEWRADLVVVGPEDPLAEGLADLLPMPCFGPSAAAARLESSKSFAKDVMIAAGVTTAGALVVDGDGPEARARCDRGGVVVKVDGLAAGKGVFVCPTPAEAHAALDEVTGARFGEAASRIVLEDLLEGPEVSVFALSDGERVVPLLSAQDHKRLLDGDRGENTGGMGVIAPCPLVGPQDVAALVEQVHLPVVREMAARGTPFRGVLYGGLMLTADGPSVLEFNVRFGDPECQALMALWDDDLLTWLYGAATGQLPSGAPRFRDGSACVVVLASAGYPRTSTKGTVIPEPPEAPDVTVFHAATARDASGALVTTGGRVLAITGTGATLREAHDRAYSAVDGWRFEGCQLRRDIGARHL